MPGPEALDVVGCDEHQQWAKECAAASVTLVKDREDLLPLTPARHRRVLLYVLGDTGGYGDWEGGGCSARFVSRLTEAGFEVHRFDYSQTGFDRYDELMDVLGTVEEYDLVLYLASLKTASNQTVVRISWGIPFGFDSPRAVEDIPHVFVSIDNPYHLMDVPMVKTFVNAYTSTEVTVDAVVDRLLGMASFTGISPADPFCGLWDARR